MTRVSTSKTQNQEVNSGERFAFGKNWERFLSVIDEQRIQQAIDSLKQMLEVETLDGKRFLDIGCGSGLFSLAARRLGADVLSFDYDPQSVACAKELKNRFFSNDVDWKIESGSVLDEKYLLPLGKFDIVYSWGVLHHTGSMWKALNAIDANVAENGKLFIAIYNDQGSTSRRWHAVKRAYNALPIFIRPLFSFCIYLPIELKSFLGYLAKGRPQDYLSFILDYKANRGMSWWYDKIDWIGGYPFEVSTPEQLFYFYKKRGYELKQLKTCGGYHGCNEVVFQRGKAPAN